MAVYKTPIYRYKNKNKNKIYIKENKKETHKNIINKYVLKQSFVI